MFKVSSEMREKAAQFIEDHYLSEASQLIRQGKCPICEKEVKEFADERHAEEFLESGMCTKCQNTTRGPAM